MNLLFPKTKNFEVTTSREEIQNLLNATSYSDFLFATSNADGSFHLKLTCPLVIVDKGGMAFLSTLKGHVITCQRYFNSFQMMEFLFYIR